MGCSVRRVENHCPGGQEGRCWLRIWILRSRSSTNLRPWRLSGAGWIPGDHPRHTAHDRASSFLRWLLHGGTLVVCGGNRLLYNVTMPTAQEGPDRQTHHSYWQKKFPIGFFFFFFLFGEHHFCIQSCNLRHVVARAGMGVLLYRNWRSLMAVGEEKNWANSEDVKTQRGWG